MAIATSKTREAYPLSKKKILKKTIVEILWLFIIFGVLYLILSIVPGKGLSEIPKLSLARHLIFWLVVTAIICLYQVWYFNVYYYNLDPDHIVIRKHPITPLEITIPYERIQDIYVDQDLLDRVLGLYDVHISSATVTSGYVAHIDGVERQAANGLRKEFLDIIGKRISKNRGERVVESSSSIA